MLAMVGFVCLLGSGELLAGLVWAGVWCGGLWVRGVVDLRGGGVYAFSMLGWERYRRGRVEDRGDDGDLGLCQGEGRMVE